MRQKSHLNSIHCLSNITLKIRNKNCMHIYHKRQNLTYGEHLRRIVNNIFDAADFFFVRAYARYIYIRTHWIRSVHLGGEMKRTQNS